MATVAWFPHADCLSHHAGQVQGTRIQVRVRVLNKLGLNGTRIRESAGVTVRSCVQGCSASAPSKNFPLSGSPHSTARSCTPPSSPPRTALSHALMICADKNRGRHGDHKSQSWHLLGPGCSHNRCCRSQPFDETLGDNHRVRATSRTSLRQAQAHHGLSVERRPGEHVAPHPEVAQLPDRPGPWRPVVAELADLQRRRRAVEEQEQTRGGGGEGGRGQGSSQVPQHRKHPTLSLAVGRITAPLAAAPLCAGPACQASVMLAHTDTRCCIEPDNCVRRFGAVAVQPGGGGRGAFCGSNTCLSSCAGADWWSYAPLISQKSVTSQCHAAVSVMASENSGQVPIQGQKVTNQFDQAILLQRSTHISTIGRMRHDSWSSCSTEAGFDGLRVIPRASASKSSASCFLAAPHAHLTWYACSAAPGSDVVSILLHLPLSQEAACRSGWHSNCVSYYNRHNTPRANRADTVRPGSGSALSLPSKGTDAHSGLISKTPV